MKLIFGSTAIKHWFPDYPNQPKDLDYIVSSLSRNKEHGIEHFKNPATDFILVTNTDPEYVDPNTLYTIKVSHLAWAGKNGKWWKHIKDVVFLQNKGCVLDTHLFPKLYHEWEFLHGNKDHISLNKATEMFFKDGVRREFDHDWLHDHFKLGDVPAYTRALLNNTSPIISKDKFFALSKEHQLHCAIEEMFVAAYERNISLPAAYKSLITTMTKGFFNLFMIQNTENLLNGFTSEKEKYIILTSKLKKEEQHENI